MRHLALSGFMGTGKTTLGRIAASALALPFVDADHAIEESAGVSVRSVWERDGEAAFRALEARVVQELLDRPEPHVIALGGGAVTNRALRRDVQERACLVTLAASIDAILARVGGARSRPNLASNDPRARVTELLGQRADAYAESHGRVVTDRGGAGASVQAIVEIYRRAPVLVALGARSYRVDVGQGSPGRLAAAIDELAPTRVALVTDATVAEARGAALEAAIAGLRAPVERVVIQAGEARKNLAAVEQIWTALLGAGVDRKSLVVGFGGGVVTDLAGFAASTVFRGIPWLAAPTTLLGMVDAAVGGKTGFDVAAGKNLIGSFHQPSAVVCDLDHLATLPAREVAAGMAEVVKIALASDLELFERLEAEGGSVLDAGSAAMAEIVRRAVECKARFVRDDEQEGASRAMLNLGHTVGHALEAHGGFSRWLHGEAVAIGIVVELEASERLGLSAPGTAARAAGTLAALDLPTTVPQAELADAWAYVARDKKRSGDGIEWPVVSAAGAGRVVRIEMGELRRAVLPT